MMDPRWIAVALLLWTTPALSAPGPAALLDEIESASLDVDGALAIRNVRLDAGLASVHLVDGALFPAVPAEGWVETEQGWVQRITEIVFVGTGRVVLDPPDEIEAGQLELFAGYPRFDETFERAVMVVAGDAATSALVDRPLANPGEEVGRRAVELYEEWRDGPERKLLDVPGAMLADAVGDPLAAGFFVGAFDSDRLGRFLYVAEPEAREQITLGQFVPLDLTDKEKREREKSLHKQQRRGRLIGLEVDDLGRWDTWVSSSMRHPDGTEVPGGPGFEPAHYELDVTVDPRDEKIEGRARVELVCQRSSNTVRLSLHPDLGVESVVDGEGRPLFFTKTRGNLTVVLGATHTPGDHVVTEVRYGGKIIRSQRFDRFSLSGTRSWMPHAGLVDRATYTATFHWPQSIELVATGRRVAHGVEDGVSWGRWEMEHPVTSFSFEVGDFEITREMVGHVEIVFAEHHYTDRDWLEKVRETLREAIPFFEEKYGEYPLDHLTVVDLDRSFYQGYMGFITLAGTRRSIIAHELAHQWWGNMVDWLDYRDQWISEAVATYSSKLYLRHREDPDYRGGPADGWQAVLDWTDDRGRQLFSFGPFVLGERLASSRSPFAYYPIVYMKGALVLEMLARTLGPDRFLAALRAVVEQSADRPITTGDFFAMVESEAGVDLSWFIDQYVHGSTMPVVTYRLEPVPSGDGRWEIHGRASQSLPSHFVYGFETLANGRFDVARKQAPRGSLERSRLVVPLQVSFDEPRRRKRRKEPETALTGHVVLQGAQSEFVVGGLPDEPTSSWLDRDQEVFGRFHDEEKYPKLARHLEAQRMLAEGRLDDAERALHIALESPVMSDELVAVSRRTVSRRADRRDVGIHLDLGRLLLDSGRLDEAEEQLKRASRAMGHRGPSVREIDILEARLELLRGDSGKAIEKLREEVSEEPRRVSTEAAALVAIDARRSGDGETLDEVVKILEARGVDTSPLAVQ